jgi:hypothetical protein
MRDDGATWGIRLSLHRDADASSTARSVSGRVHHAVARDDGADERLVAGDLHPVALDGHLGLPGLQHRALDLERGVGNRLTSLASTGTDSVEPWADSAMTSSLALASGRVDAVTVIEIVVAGVVVPSSAVTVRSARVPSWMPRPTPSAACRRPRR